MSNKDKKIVVGQVVNFYDRAGKASKALVKGIFSEAAGTKFPCLILVRVSGDPARSGALGPQILVECSVVHASNQIAGGNFWTWPGECPVESEEDAA